MTEAYVFNPEGIKDEWATQEFERILAHFWTHNEFNYAPLRQFYLSIPTKHQHMLKVVLTFFVYSDGKVNEGLEHRVIPLCDLIEQQHLYVQQCLFEVIHARTYSLLAQSLFPNYEERREVVNGNYARSVIDSIEDATNHIFNLAIKDGEPNYDKRIETFFGFACIENLFFSPMFVIIYYFKYQYASGVHDISALTTSNEMIARDESEHVNTHSHMVRYYSSIDSYDKDELIQILNYMLKVAYGLCEAVVELIGEDDSINLKSLNRYVRLQANNMLADMNIDHRVDDAGNDFPWMDNMGFYVKTNNFEVLTTSYHATTNELTREFNFYGTDKL